MSWWNSVPNSDCIFALDANSKLIGNSLYFSNDANRYLILQPETIITTNKTVAGQKPYTNNPMELHVYNSLSISKGNLFFDEPLYIGTSFTIILKCKVNQSSVFLSNNAADHGPAYGVGVQNNSVSTSSDDHAWRVHGFITESEVPYNNRQFKIKTDIKTLILTGDMNTKEVVAYTESGIYPVPKDSAAFITGFLQPRSYTNIGYSNSTVNWRLNADIIAYGIFNRQMSVEEFKIIDASIESELKIKVIPENISNKSKSYTDISLKTVEYSIDLMKTYENNFQASKPVRAFIKNLDYELSITEHENTLYKNTKNISDIVLEENVPIKTKLYLYEKYTGQLLKTTGSDSLGRFSFLDLNPQLDYIVRTSDPKYHFQSVLKDYNKGT